ncbi:UNVERIFIED_CONTAM: hypothetical protein K2H54_026642, partial [Gekko kuhli]
SELEAMLFNILVLLASLAHVSREGTRPLVGKQRAGTAFWGSCPALVHLCRAYPSIPIPKVPGLPVSFNECTTRVFYLFCVCTAQQQEERGKNPWRLNLAFDEDLS